jgi:hypothetical protein
VRYGSAATFRQALEDRLKERAGRDGARIARLRKQVAFDRLLARLAEVAPGIWPVRAPIRPPLRLPVTGLWVPRPRRDSTLEDRIEQRRNGCVTGTEVGLQPDLRPRRERAPAADWTQPWEAFVRGLRGRFESLDAAFDQPWWEWRRRE